MNHSQKLILEEAAKHGAKKISRLDTVAEVVNQSIEEANTKPVYRAGDKVQVPFNGKMVTGKVVRFDSGGTDKARQHGGGYVVDVGQRGSVTIPAHLVRAVKKEGVEEKTRVINEEADAVFAKFLIKDFHVSLSVDPKNPRVIVSKSRAGTHNLSRADLEEFLNKYPVGDFKDAKSHFSVDYSDGGYEYVWYMGSHWQKKFLGRELGKTASEYTWGVGMSGGGRFTPVAVNHPAWRKAVMAAYLKAVENKGAGMKEEVEETDTITEAAPIPFNKEIENFLKGLPKEVVADLKKVNAGKKLEVVNVTEMQKRVKNIEAVLKKHKIPLVLAGKATWAAINLHFTKVHEAVDHIEEGVRVMPGAEKLIQGDPMGGSPMVRSFRNIKKSLEGKPAGSVLLLTWEGGQKDAEEMSIDIYEPNEFSSLIKGFSKKPEAKVGSKGSWTGGTPGDVIVLAIKEGVEEAYAHPNEKPIGAFTLAGHTKFKTTAHGRFEYRISQDAWGKSHGLPHEVCVSRKDPNGRGDWRSANVKGTVCYIAVDEGADGKPVIEKWAITRHVKYVKAESVEQNDVEELEEASGFKMNDPRLVAAAQSILPPEDKNNGPLIGKITRFMFDVWASGNGKTRLPELTRLARTKFGLTQGRSSMQTNEFTPEESESVEEAMTSADIVNKAKEIVAKAKELGVRVSCEPKVITCSKEFTKGDKNAFFKAYADCDKIRSMVPFKSRTNEWGCSTAGVGIGAQECIKAGMVVLNKSGDGASYVLTAMKAVKNTAGSLARAGIR